jgi:hypothetical protein
LVLHNEIGYCATTTACCWPRRVSDCRRHRKGHVSLIAARLW